MSGLQATDERKLRGDFPTPRALVEPLVEQVLGPVVPGRRVRVLDPACGDGRFLVAAGHRIRAAGGQPELHGVDVHPAAIAAARRELSAVRLDARLTMADALDRDWGGERFDAVVGNPPYLSQLAAATTRGRASRHGGGPYADAAAEFLALGMRLVGPGGRVGFVLPQSILASRDAGPVRELVDREAVMTWSWWSSRKLFDADVRVCGLVFERRPGGAGEHSAPWTRVVTTAVGVPSLPAVAAAGRLGDRGLLTANFRDQYYGLIGAVHDGRPGGDRLRPPLITSGLIDPARCWWGQRPVRFAGTIYERPRVQLGALSPAMRRWAQDLLVPKVLVANQTAALEAVADEPGSWLPGVPVLSIRPSDPALVVAVAAVLTSPVATCWAWHRAAGTGLSARALRLGPRWLAGLPWPAGDLGAAVDAHRAGDVVACGAAVQAAYGLGGDDGEELMGWWTSSLPARR